MTSMLGALVVMAIGRHGARLAALDLNGLRVPTARHGHRRRAARARQLRVKRHFLAKVTLAKHRNTNYFEKIEKIVVDAEFHGESEFRV